MSRGIFGLTGKNKNKNYTNLTVLIRCKIFDSAIYLWFAPATAATIGIFKKKKTLSRMPIRLGRGLGEELVISSDVNYLVGLERGVHHQQSEFDLLALA